MSENTADCCIFVSDNLEIQIMVSTILPKEWTKLTILSKDDAQDSEFHLFFGRIQENIHCFRDLWTFNSHTKYDKLRATISMKRLIIKGRLYCMFLFSEQIWEKSGEYCMTTVCFRVLCTHVRISKCHWSIFRNKVFKVHTKMFSYPLFS